MEPIVIQTPAGSRAIGPGHPVFVIAEMSGNHGGDLDRARALVDAAVDAGVDAIKLQTYTPDTMTIDCANEYFQVKSNDAWRGKSLYELYRWAHTPWEWQPGLKEHAERRGVLLFSTPFDHTSVDFLERMNVALYKVASFESGDIPLLRKIGSTRKPVIMSRGMSSLAATELAAATLREAGAPQVAVLHCVSAYPARAEDMNLATIPDLAARTGMIVGLSDHTLGTTVAIASVALGASIIEKHFTLDRSEGGPDAGFSLEPAELAQLMREVRIAESALGAPRYEVIEREAENVIFRRSIFVVEDVRQGEPLTARNTRIIRPGNGLEPREYDRVLGSTAARDLVRGTPLAWEHVRERS